MNLFTIGYERDTVEGVIARLKQAKVAILVDVRAVTSSRRPGFSKRQLAANLDEAGIAYVHLRALGTPSAGRTAARAGRTREMREIYESHLAEPDAHAELGDLARIAGAQNACLLCYEAEAERCHRRVLAERLQARLKLKVRDL